MEFQKLIASSYGEDIDKNILIHHRTATWYNLFWYLFYQCKNFQCIFSTSRKTKKNRKYHNIHQHLILFVSQYKIGYVTKNEPQNLTINTANIYFLAMLYIQYELVGILLCIVTQGPRLMRTSLSSCSYLCAWLRGGKYTEKEHRGFLLPQPGNDIVTPTHSPLAITNYMNLPKEL